MHLNIFFFHFCFVAKLINFIMILIVFIYSNISCKYVMITYIIYTLYKISEISIHIIVISFFISDQYFISKKFSYYFYKNMFLYANMF